MAYRPHRVQRRAQQAPRGSLGFLSLGGSSDALTFEGYISHGNKNAWPRPMTAARLAVTNIILAEFTAAGFGPAQTLGAWVNAVAESGLDPKIQSAYYKNGKREDSIGLFQLNSEGAGAGMTTAQREDPKLNTQRIIQEARLKGARFMTASTIADAAYWFCVEVENPADSDAKGKMRAGYAQAYFGDLAASISPPTLAGFNSALATAKGEQGLILSTLQTYLGPWSLFNWRWHAVFAATVALSLGAVYAARKQLQRWI